MPLSFALIFTPIYVTYLDTEQYGVLNLFVLYSSIFAQVIGFGVARGFLYFYWDVYKSESKLKELISSTFGLLLLFQFLFLSIGLMLGKPILSLLVKSEEQFPYYPLFILTLFQSVFLIYHEMFGYFFRNQGKLKEYAILSAGTLVLLTIGSLIGIVYLDLKAEGAIWGRFFGYGIIITCFLFFLINRYGVSLKWKQSKVLLAFSIPIFINAFIGSLSHGVDKLLIERLDTLHNLGIYGFAVVFVSILEIWLGSINNALSPTLYRFMNEDMEAKKTEIEGLVYLIIFSVFLLISCMLALLKPTLELMFPPEYHDITTLVPILATAFLWRVFTSMSLYSIYIKKKTKLLLYNETSVLVLVIFLGYLGYQLLGILGIVIGLYLVKLIEYIIMRRLSRQTLKLPFQLNNFYILTIILSASAFSCSFLENVEHINSYFLFTTPLIVFLLVTPFLLKKEIRKTVYILKHRKQLIN